MKIVFMGTPDFAVPALNEIKSAGHEVVAVYTAPPKEAGRGKELRKSKVHEAAEKLGLFVKTPASLKNEQLPECDIAVVAAYGFLLPKAVLEAPKYGCINIHPSLLPRWRGAAPLQRTIMAGDKETGVGIMQMNEGLDTGDVLAEGKFTLEPKTTVGQLHDKTAELGAKMVVDVINNIKVLKPHKQSEQGVTYAKKLTRADELIDWSKPAEEVSNQVYGLNPFPAAYFDFNGEKIKVFEGDVVTSSGKPATALDDNLTIACGSGAFQITKLQRPGKKPMAAKEFLNGFKIAKGACLATS